MLNQDDIDNQQALLAAHRRTLAVYLHQQAALGVLTPPGVVNGIAEVRDQIGQIKAVLRAASVAVDDHPNDTPPLTPQQAAGLTDATQDVLTNPSNRITQMNVSTGGGDYAEGTIDKRQGTFIAGDAEVIQFITIGAGAAIPEGGIIGKQVNYYAPKPDAPPDRNRQAMLTKVKTIWVTGLLERSLAAEARIALGLVERPDAVDLVLNTQFQELDMPPRALPAGTQIVDVFAALGGALLILGAPGAGKTTLLLELARDLIARAEQDPYHPIPVVVNLSSWAHKRRPLTEWLVDELNTKYDVPRRVGKAWVEGDALLPLLDGLDEVQPEHRVACVEAINAFRTDHGLVPLTVCSRIADYDALAKKLRLQGAVLVQPLTPEQIDAYLARAGQKLAGVRAALQHDAPLRELAATPLLLSVMALAYQDMPVESLEVVETAQERRRHLFDAYIEAMFKRRSRQTRFSREQTVQWLGWLARGMVAHTQTLLHIERLQPAWLQAPWHHRYYAMGEGLAVGAILGFGVGTIWWLTPALNTTNPLESLKLEQITIAGLASGAVQLLAWLFSGLLAGIGMGVLMGLVIGVLMGLVNREQAFDQAAVQRGWQSLHTAIPVGCAVGLLSGLAFGIRDGLGGGVWQGLGFGLVAGLASGIGAGALYGLAVQPGSIAVVETLGWSWLQARRWLAVTLAAGLGIGLIFGQVTRPAYGLAVGLAVGLVAGLFRGLTGGEIEAKTLPNQGIRRSIRNAVRIGCLAWLTMGLVTGSLGGLARGVTLGMSAWNLVLLVIWFSAGWLVNGLAGGVGAGLVYGGFAVIQHLALRCVLWRSGALPLHLVAFLDYCAERIFLRKVGGGYLFAHRLLMEHFAALEQVVARQPESQ
ncbi:MAG: NACHT domain-containing protein [Chloroflexota bacterium]|nr:NACHT domain-containing protein [Chloroflexota bacterium]